MPLLHHLETIDVDSCGSIEVLVYSKNSEEGVIRFVEIKHLSLQNLPALVGFSNSYDVINLPPLVTLVLRRLPNFTSIYPEYKSALTSAINNPLLKNMLYTKLERFSISMGCYLKENGGEDLHSPENTLMLDANKDELFESGINELLLKTEVLHLAAGGMNNLEEVLPKSVPRYLFYNLRVLHIFRCADLRYLFTVPVARVLVTLERLTIEDCPLMESLIYSENGEEAVVIMFQELKHIVLDDLPMLVGLSNTNGIIDLPQLVELVLRGLPNFTCIYPEYKSVGVTSVSSSSSSAIKPFFNKVVLTPRLERLGIYHMEALKNIWPCSSEEVDACLLREITVGLCDNLVNLFPMPLLHHLQTINIDSCCSIEVLVYGENGEEGVIRFQELKHLALGNLPIFVGFCNTNDVIDLPQLVKLVLTRLPNFTSIYPEYKSASAATSEMSSSSSALKPFFNKEVMIPHGLERMEIYHMEALKNIWPCGSSEEIEVDACLLREIKVENCNNLVNMFPIYPMPLLYHLERITVACCDSIEVLFDIDVACLGEMKESDSKLRFIRVISSGKLREVWRLKGVINSDLIICGFQAVECILIIGCKSFRNVFTPPTARFDLGADIITAGSNYNGSEEVNENGTERNQEEVPALNIKKSASEGNLK